MKNIEFRHKLVLKWKTIIFYSIVFIIIYRPNVFSAHLDSEGLKMARLLMIKFNQGLNNVGELRWTLIRKFKIKRGETAGKG